MGLRSAIAGADRHTITDARRSDSNRTGLNHQNTKSLRHEMRKQTTIKRFGIPGFMSLRLRVFVFLFRYNVETCFESLLIRGTIANHNLESAGLNDKAHLLVVKAQLRRSQGERQVTLLTWL